ncbi:hypothetical protein ACROYT_G007688 [Oculina patagonica]
MRWIFALIFIAVQTKCFLAFECSNNAQVPYDGDRVIRASDAFTCSWVITIPENYTVELTITQKNVGSIGNTNCANDYIQIRDGASSSSTLLKKFCNSNPGPSVFRSSGTQLWVEYKSTQPSNSFEASFKKLLDQSFCPKNVISNGTEGTLSSPFYPSNYPNDMECSWNITGPSGTRLILVFYRICLGVCTTGMPCDCDRLVISEAFNSKQLCSGSDVIPFISLENKISLSMSTDGQYTSKGFVAKYQSVPLDGACSQMIQLTNASGRFSSPNFPSNYPGDAQCGWNISIPAGYKIYLTFLEFDLEECGSSCTCDYVEVADSKDFSSKKCGTIPSGEWEVKDVIDPNIVVKFKSDSQSNKKGFEAVYTLVSLDGWDSIPPGHCPWTQSTTKEPVSSKDGVTTESIETAIAQTAPPEVMTSAVSTAKGDPTTVKNATERRKLSGLLSLITICALILLSYSPE